MKDLELTKIKALIRTKDGRWVNVVSYDGYTIEWFYSDTMVMPERVGIITSQIKIEGKSKAKGRAYFRNDTKGKDFNTIYIDELVILDLDLFDMDETND